MASSLNLHHLDDPHLKGNPLITEINSQLALFRDLLIHIGTSRDSPELREKIRKLRRMCVDACRSTAQHLLPQIRRYLSTGLSFASLQYEFDISDSSIGDIVMETCKAISTVVKPVEIPKITQQEQWCAIADNFYKKTNFPNCVGAIDGKHVACVKPPNSGSRFFNYKKHFSTVLMAVVDANLNFIAINVGAHGEEGDSTVFRDCSLGKKLYSGQLNLPPPQVLPNTQYDPQPFVFVGDEAFKIHTNLLRPYPARDLDGRRRVFNYRLSRCRRTVECAFGILSNKWRVFHTPIMVRPDKIDEIVKACCTLHNFVRRRDGANFDYTVTSHTFADIANCGTAERAQGNDVRNAFANYFIGPGAVSFQQQHMF